MVPVSTSVKTISTRHQRFTCVCLLDPHLTASRAAFSLTFTTATLNRCNSRWFEVCACTPAPRGQPSSLVKHCFHSSLNGHVRSTPVPIFLSFLLNLMLTPNLEAQTEAFSVIAGVCRQRPDPMLCNAPCCPGAMNSTDLFPRWSDAATIFPLRVLSCDTSPLFCRPHCSASAHATRLTFPKRGVDTQ